MKITQDTGLIELATTVCERLREYGVEAVLSGGAAVSIFTDGRYMSRDLDFVTSADIGQLVEILRPLGFVRGSDRRHLVHPKTSWYVEFPPGPVQAGNAILNEWMQLETEYGVLLLLSPTQMVMDRLAAYFHWNDPQSLEQARMIAHQKQLDWQALDDWAESEAELSKYRYFKSTL